MLKFRKINTADAETVGASALAALLPRPDYAAEALRSGAAVFVMYEDAVPASLLAVSGTVTDTRPRCAVVDCMVMREENRRRGLGRMMMGLAANDAVGHGVYFLAGAVPDTAEAQGFAKAIGFRQTPLFADMQVLDLSDVSGLRHG